MLFIFNRATNCNDAYKVNYYNALNGDGSPNKFKFVFLFKILLRILNKLKNNIFFNSFCYLIFMYIKIKIFFNLFL